MIKADLGDQRLNRSARRVLAKLGEKPTLSIPAACGGWHETRAAYRLFDHDAVTAEAVLAEQLPNTGLTYVADREAEKSELGLRPIDHRTAARVDGHLFISVQAYQFVQLIRRRLRAHGISDRWSTLRAILAGQCRVIATFRRADGRTLHVRKATRAEPTQLAIIQALGSDPSPGGIQKMSV